MDISAFRRALGRMSYAIEHTIFSSVHQTLAAFHFHYRNQTLEIMGTNGHRFAWQRLRVQGDGAFDFAVLRRDLERMMMNAKKWKTCDVSLSESGDKAFFINPVNILQSDFCPAMPTWPRDAQDRSLLDVLVLRETVRAQTTFDVSWLHQAIADEKLKTPLTYPGMDNNDLAFVSINASGMHISLGTPPSDPHDVCISLQVKLLSAAIRFLDPSTLCMARISSSAKGDLLLILEDRSGGHCIVSCKPIKTSPLGSLREGWSFRVPGSPATFYFRSSSVAWLEHGTPSDKLLSYLVPAAGYFCFPYRLEVFLETVNQEKVRRRNGRPYSQYPTLDLKSFISIPSNP